MIETDVSGSCNFCLLQSRKEIKNLIYKKNYENYIMYEFLI